MDYYAMSEESRPMRPDQTRTPHKVKRPPIATMERWMSKGLAKATDGCEVEPDGTCPHGKQSWLLVLGYI